MKYINLDYFKGKHNNWFQCKFGSYQINLYNIRLDNPEKKNYYILFYLTDKNFEIDFLKNISFTASQTNVIGFNSIPETHQMH